jgi:hypothetical protein
MDPKQQRILEQREPDEIPPEDEPRPVSADDRPRAGKADAGYGGGQASGRTGGTAVSEEITDAPPTGHGHLGRRPAGPDVHPKRPGKEDHH